MLNIRIDPRVEKRFEFEVGVSSPGHKNILLKKLMFCANQ
jgi:hypothetical protein